MLSLFGRVTRTELFEVKGAIDMLAVEVSELKKTQKSWRVEKGVLLRRIRALEDILREFSAEVADQVETEEFEESNGKGVDTRESQAVEDKRLRVGRGQ